MLRVKIGLHRQAADAALGGRLMADGLIDAGALAQGVATVALLAGVAQIEEVRVDLDPSARVQMMEITGRRTVPQIFIGSTHVGGCDDLVELDSRGGLTSLLAAA